MAYCPKCNARVADDARFCHECGTEIGAANPYEAGSAFAPSSTPTYSSSADAPPIPGFGQAVSICFHKYFDCKGRASRSEYWYWALFTIIVQFIAAVIVGIGVGGDEEVIGNVAQIVSGCIGLFFFCPGLMVWIRRMHDIDKSGWTALLLLLLAVPFLNLIVLVVFLIWLVRKGTDGPNRFGPAPRKR